MQRAQYLFFFSKISKEQGKIVYEITRYDMLNRERFEFVTEWTRENEKLEFINLEEKMLE